MILNAPSIAARLLTDRLSVLKSYLYYKYRRPFRTRAELERWQDRKVAKHLKYVSEHSPVYKGMKTLADYAIADKSFMMEHFDDLNTVGVKRREAEEFAVKAERDRNFSPKLHGVTVGLSSGTSGQRGIFLVSDAEKNQWAGYVLARFLPGSILGSYSIAFFMRADSNLYQAVRSKNIRFYFFDIYRDMREHRKRLEKISPQILAGQPSVLLMLAEEMRERRLKIRPQIVISIAEVLEKEDEICLKKAFGLPVIHQVYQCTEGCLAATCERGTLHLNEDIVHIEREYLDQRRFVPIVTDFERKAQPIIRYRLNDILVERRTPCGCKNPCLALEKIEGREDDVFSFPDGNGGERKVFPDFIRRCILFAQGEPGREGAQEDFDREIAREGSNQEIAQEELSREIIQEMPDQKSAQESSAQKTGEYRVVQGADGNITVYADFGEEMRGRVVREFEKLGQDMDFCMPQITFEPYRVEKGKKMKRVERTGTGKAG